MKRVLQVFLITAVIYLSALENALSYNRSTRVYIGDSNTPLELANPNVPWVYRDIMVGTRLTIIVDSNVGGLWGYGELSIWGTDRDNGVLAGRDRNEETLDCPGSILPAAGDYATAVEYDDNDACCVQFWIDQGAPGAVAGDWFIVDYNATSVGNCHVSFFDWDVMEDPLYELSFKQVPSRDFNGDNIVNFADFSFLGSYWGVSGCTDPDGCGKADLDGNGTIDIDDLGLFADFWLERTN